MKIAVLYNSADEGGFLKDDIKYVEDAIANAGRIVNRFNDSGNHARLIEITRKNLTRQLIDVKKWVDVVFNLTEAVGLGLVLEIIGKLEDLDIPFAGASEYGHKLTSDKSLVKKVIREMNVPTPEWKIYTKHNFRERWPGRFPVIVKSTTEHGSMSIHQDSVTSNQKQMKDKVKELLDKYKGLPVMVEAYIDGREINSTVIGSYEWARCLPLSEMVFEGSYKRGTKWPIYTYEAKYNYHTVDFDDAPARLVNWLTPKEMKLIENISLSVCEATECFDYARTDIRFDLKSRTPYMVDLNSYPCLLEDTKYDTIGISRSALGWDFNKLIMEIAKSGIRRHQKYHNIRRGEDQAYAI